MDYSRPTLLIDRERAIRNIERMQLKAGRSGVIFRPHFKTHQSAEVGEWFRQLGVDRITVSSLDMAAYFAGHGWKDITVAFPVNTRQIDLIRHLASSIKLNLLVESRESIEMLDRNLNGRTGLWLKIDVGSHRTGLDWEDPERVMELADLIGQSRHLKLEGLLTHAGHTYRAGSPEEIKSIYFQTAQIMNGLRDSLVTRGFSDCLVSVGDTPACSIVNDFSAVDEIRPGNFVYYDLMQYRLGACRHEEIAALVACPVVALHPKRSHVILYGGAVHLSKDSLMINQHPCYGAVIVPGSRSPETWIPEASVISLSQEHGVVRIDPPWLDSIKPGYCLMIVPVHSCLTVACFNHAYDHDGRIVHIFQHSLHSTD